MNKTLFVTVLWAAAVSAGCGSAPSPSAAADPPVAVSVGRASVADEPDSFEAGGVVVARATAAIASRVMAPVLSVHVRPGDRVRVGVPLVTLDARESQAQSSRASAALAGAVSDVHAAESEVAAAEAGVRLARATHERLNTLFGKRSATAQELDQAVAALGTAEAQVTASRARSAAATAGRDAARAAMEVAAIGASYTVLSAPLDGVVTERRVDPGSMVMPGQPLLVLDDAAAYRLEVRLDEARAAYVRIGDAADMIVGEPSGSARWAAARVVEVARLDSASHAFVVKIEGKADLKGADAAGPALRSGLFGRARFTGPARRALTVPASALLRRGQLTFIFLVDAGAARLRAISPGAVIGDRVEVLAGVRDGDAVVLTPPASLTDGAPISVGDRR